MPNRHDSPCVLRAIERECREQTRLEGEVETLHHGGRYRLTRYRTYGDVRLEIERRKDAQMSFAPED